MNKQTMFAIAGATLAGGVALAVVLRRKDGSTLELDELEEVQVTAQRIGSSEGVPAIAAALPAGTRWGHANGERFRALFDRTEQRYGIPSGLLFRQAYQESRFRDDIISGKTRSSAGAVGIMQIIPRWHPELSPGDASADERAALDVSAAVDYAGSFLSKLRKQFGSWELALAAYNAGPGNVNKYGGIPPFKETQDYVAQITADVPVRNV
jgi:soluble lytic murein transglycosylase-like protein